jgi:hypothetical protein
MAAPSLASHRRPKNTYGNRVRPNLSEDTPDIFGVSRSPSPAAPKSRAQPTKSAKSALVADIGHTASSKSNETKARVAANAAPKRDVYDLPDSDEEATRPITKPLATKAPKKAQLKSDVKTARIGVPAKKDVSKSQAVKPAAAGEVSKKRPREASQPPVARATQERKEKAPKSDLFDFPGSSDEGPSRSAVTFSSKIDFRNKSSNAAKRQKSVEPTVQRPVKVPVASALSKAPLKQRTEDRKPARQASQEPTSMSQPVNMALPHRQHARAASTKISGREAAKITKKPVAGTSKRNAMQSGHSAPAVLSKMIEGQPLLAKKPKVVPVSPSPPQSPTVTKMANTTPSPRHSATPERKVRDVTQTPKQKALWGKLLDTLGDVNSPSDLPVSDLSLTTAKKRSDLVDERLAATSSTNPRKRVKLISTLKKTIPVIEEDEDEDETEDESSESESERGLDLESEDEITQREQGAENTQKPQTTTFAAPAKLTYAQQRSYLAEQTEEDMLDAMIEDMSQPLTKSMETSQKDDFDLESDDDDDDAGGQPKSAHDLRAAGSKKRMLQDLENLISGLENETLGASSKRADLIEVSNTLLNPSTVELVLDHGMDRQLVTSFTKSKDTVFDFIGTCCLGLIVRCTKQLAVLRGFSRAGCIEKLFDLLEIDKNISVLVKERRSNMSGIAQRKVLALEKSIVQSDLWSGVIPASMSPQLAALRLLELLIRRMRELGGDDIAMDEERLLQILEILASHESSKDSGAYAWLVFSILESTSVGNYSSKRGPWTPRTYKVVSKRLASILTQSKEESKSARRLGLAVSMNLTNNNPRACDAFAKPELITPVLQAIVHGFESISDIEQDDELILCLGTMINMAELSDTARLCVLSDGSASLGQLVTLFCDRLDRAADATSLESSRHNVPFGYLALLLVNLCQTDSLRTEVLRLLPGSAQLTGLIRAAEEFITIHQQTDMEMLAEGENDSGQASALADYTRRLMGMVNRLKEVAH